MPPHAAVPSDAEARQDGEAVNEQEAESSSAPAAFDKSPAPYEQIPSSAKAESSSAPAAFDNSPAPYDQIPSSAAALMHLQQFYESSEEEDEGSSTSVIVLSEEETESSSTSSFALSEEEAEISSTSAEDYPTMSGKSRSKKRKGKLMRREGKRKRSSGSRGQGRRFPHPKKIKLRDVLKRRNWPKMTGEILADLEDYPDIDEESAEFLAAERKALSKLPGARDEGLNEAREEARNNSLNKTRDEAYDKILNEACKKARNEAFDEALKIQDSLAEVLNESGKLNKKLDEALKHNEALNETFKEISTLNKRLTEALKEIGRAADEIRK
ncbi:uncharacterized protein PSANT_01142 [Moesziomyces antarcticus]|uniref:Uncharacterized protein n=1 Tax=Pseudozyma antarctica TaxID=84753 RepID=A0A5C3FIB2_PSEA2|nr:uncharacterized protein PSANT_01142 [Moesziomyces antarcticus]